MSDNPNENNPDEIYPDEIYSDEDTWDSDTEENRIIVVVIDPYFLLHGIVFIWIIFTIVSILLYRRLNSRISYFEQWTKYSEEVMDEESWPNIPLRLFNAIIAMLAIFLIKLIWWFMKNLYCAYYRRET